MAIQEKQISGKAFYDIMDKIANKNPDNYANILNFNIFHILKLSAKRMNNNSLLGSDLRMFWAVYIHNLSVSVVLNGDFGTPITSAKGTPQVIKHVRQLINCKPIKTLLKHDSKARTPVINKARLDMMNALKMVNSLNRISNSIFQYLKYGRAVLAKFDSTFTALTYDPKKYKTNKSASALIYAGIAEGLKQDRHLIGNKKFNNKGKLFKKYNNPIQDDLKDNQKHSNKKKQ